MSDEHQSVIDDREWYMLDGFARYRRLFFDRIFPWLIFAALLLGIYYVMLNGLQLLIELSGPVSDWMRKAGL